ncbi:carboxylating nicotinate-nucleotide diphosphorylase [Clostridium folliculivorans]|uniref:Probable nicotinate-nucleotide pyrophosphorylase [carboxylating] n=1 Tax=Clostridium folliculivorans TaxID=2886038 RepID=A0A9W6DA02_9CLOT|nr:carboxylating nicotinate-nucleotide diphosphorylase [Clostridium folliculivorans]GKU24689.1 nicotinate-nucleotide diphosphorylase (carboxylating) [Clostridium folliculivorans]GKU30787.1 nicotinate-nucleotide diphosphorylase (carboxylating) [Clostridium folliculivorans]
MNWSLYDDIFKNAIKEDAPYGDITTMAITNESKTCTADLIVKDNGVIAGLGVFKRIFEILGPIEIDFYIKDGESVKKGQVIAKIHGKSDVVLTGERVALNFLQRISGIATITKQYVDEIKETGAKLLDTRKTTPNMRVFEKYAVKVGGGINHRLGLSDGVLIKDNHIAAAGGINNAVNLVKNAVPFVRKIEVEVEDLTQLQEALDAGADIIMLDNMNIETMTKAVQIINKKALTEASGNITIENIRTVAMTGVDYISSGTLTHSSNILDLSLKNLKLED